MSVRNHSLLYYGASVVGGFFALKSAFNSAQQLGNALVGKDSFEERIGTIWEKVIENPLSFPRIFLGSDTFEQRKVHLKKGFESAFSASIWAGLSLSLFTYLSVPPNASELEQQSVALDTLNKEVRESAGRIQEAVDQLANHECIFESIQWKLLDLIEPCIGSIKRQELNLKKIETQSEKPRFEKSSKVSEKCLDILLLLGEIRYYKIDALRGHIYKQIQAFKDATEYLQLALNKVRSLFEAHMSWKLLGGPEVLFLGRLVHPSYTTLCDSRIQSFFNGTLTECPKFEEQIKNVSQTLQERKENPISESYDIDCGEILHHTDSNLFTEFSLPQNFLEQVQEGEIDHILEVFARQNGTMPFKDIHYSYSLFGSSTREAFNEEEELIDEGKWDIYADKVEALRHLDGSLQKKQRQQQFKELYKKNPVISKWLQENEGVLLHDVS